VVLAVVERVAALWLGIALQLQPLLQLLGTEQRHLQILAVAAEAAAVLPSM
jgi:hypothetical protein